MTGTKLPREMDTPAFRANLAAQVATRAEDAADAAATHASVVSTAMRNTDEDMAVEHAEDAIRCSDEAEAAVEYIRAIGACADGDGYHRAIQAARNAKRAAHEARQHFPDSISAQHEEAARQHPEIMGAPEPQTPYEHGPKPASTDEKRLVWLRALYLIRQGDRDGNLIARMAGHGIVPPEVLRDADAIFSGSFRTPIPFSPDVNLFDDTPL